MNKIFAPKYSIHTRLREFHLRRFMRNEPFGYLLDIGCGLGYLTENLGDGFMRIGIDDDIFALKDNIKRGLNNMLLADATNLPFQEGAFDVIICSEVLEHLSEGADQNALFEMARILKQGGQLLITVPSLEGIRARSALRNLGHEDSRGGEYHYRIGYSWKEIKNIIKRIPALEIKRKRYSMFIFSELFMDLLKLAYFKKNKLNAHSDLRNLKDSTLLLFYRFFFPILYRLFVYEDLFLTPIFKGHILILELEKKG